VWELGVNCVWVFVLSGAVPWSSDGGGDIWKPVCGDEYSTH
jgi:hypothetical protein